MLLGVKLLLLLVVLMVSGCKPRVAVKTAVEFQQVVRAAGVGKVEQEYCFYVLAKFKGKHVVWSGCVNDEKACKAGQSSAKQLGGIAGAVNVTECKPAGVVQQVEAPDSKPGQ